MRGNMPETNVVQLAEDLRKIEIFRDLPDDQMAWLVEHLEELRFGPG